MKRKVIQIADSTQLISLPRKWALKHAIAKGDELDVNEEGNRLVVSTTKGYTPGKAEVDISGLDRDSAMYLVRSLYKNGYDEMIIHYKQALCEDIRSGQTSPYIEIISKEITRLPGVEIFSQKENYCVIRSISEDTTKAFDTMLRRVFLLSIETIADFIEGYEKGDKAILETIQQKHDVVTKFVTYCQRLLNKLGYSDYTKTDVMYHILEVIDIIMDLAKYNARDIINNKIKASKESIQFCRHVQTGFELYYDLFYNYSVQKIFNLNKNRYDFIKKLSENKDRIPKDEFMILTNMEQILEHILNLTTAKMSLQY